MKKHHTILGIAAAAMLAVAPTASAGYWTIHSEIIHSIVENFVIKVLQTRDTTQDAQRIHQRQTVKQEKRQQTPVKR